MTTTGKQNPSKRLSGLALSRQSGIPGQGEYLVNADILSAIYPTVHVMRTHKVKIRTLGEHRLHSKGCRGRWIQGNPGCHLSRTFPQPPENMTKMVIKAFKGFTKQRTPGEQLKVFGEPSKS